MRISFPTVVLTSVLLVKETGASLAARHGHFHKRVLDVITDWDIIYQTVTDVVWVTVTGDDGAVTTTTTPAAIASTPTTTSVPVVEPAPTTPATTVAPASTPSVPAPVASTVSSSSAVAVVPSSVVAAPPAPVVSTSPVALVQTPTTLSTVVAPSSVAAPVTSVEAPTPVAAPVTSVAAPATTSSAPAAAASFVTSSSGSKRGLSYNDVSLLSAFTGSSLINWCYNWGSTSDGTVPSNFEFVPMLWGLESSTTDSWNTNAQAAIANGATALLCFNEPDNAGQSNIDAADAAAGYKTYMNPLSGSAQLGAPAVTNGGAPAGLTWLGDFLDACAGECDIDFVPIHWYDSATNYAYFKEYIQEAYVAGGNRTLWITEFGATGSTAEQTEFLQVVMPWLDQQDYVGRYAYFMDSVGVLLESVDDLSSIGSTFMDYTSSTINSLIADV